jgi:hypothetical protein
MRRKEMKATILLFCLVVGFLIATTSLSVAQVPASQDTIVIPGGATNAGVLEATINGDTTAAGLRIHPNRVYRLHKNTIYTQHAGINIKNPTGTLIMVGEQGGTKPVIVLTGVNGVDPGMNLIQGSIKLDNIHMQSMITNDGLLNRSLWVGTTSGGLPQSVEVNNCLFEFASLELFQCDGYTDGAKFRFTNSYFRNFFNPNQWWGGRVFYCKRSIDTLWVENCTVTDGGMIFLQSNSLCRFAYFNHNTIINSNQCWLSGVYYLEVYWVNNLFINQNWVGEDLENIASTGDGGSEPGMLTGTIGLDTIMTSTNPHINIQPEFLLPDGTIDPSKCGPDKIKAFVSNNILWTDTVLLEPYYKNKQVGAYGPYGNVFLDTCPASYLGWCGCGNPPYKVVNIPCIWMNSRTANLFSGKYSKIVQKDNLINVQVNTVTPAIKDAATANQMALWNAAKWGVTGLATDDITHSAYIFGDYDPLTIPGIKTENGEGITKFTDLIENFAQTGTVKLSTIDQLPIGSLIWNDACCGYNSSYAYAAVMASYNTAVGVESKTSGLPISYELSQNFPNPFNPTTTIDFALPKASDVKLSVYNLLGQKVATLVDTRMSAGQQSVVFDASKLSSGVYFYRLNIGAFTQTKKMIMLK